MSETCPKQCPRCGSETTLTGLKGTLHHSCESIDYHDGNSFISVACRDLELASLRASLADSQQQVEFYRNACSRANDEVCQIAGKALGYMWYKDDQETFPGATEENGVFVGEHVAATIVEELIRKYADEQRMREEAERERDGELQARTNAEFELLALRDEVARLKRPLTGEELRIDAAEVELRSEMLADEGEELTVPLRDYNKLSADALALDAEWREKAAALTARAEAEEKRAEGMKEAAIQVIEMNRQHAYDQYGDRERAEAWSCIRVLRAALLAPAAEEVQGGK